MENNVINMYVYSALYIYFYFKYVTGLPLLDVILFGPLVYMLFIDRGKSLNTNDKYGIYILSFLIAINMFADKLYALILSTYNINVQLLNYISAYFYSFAILFILLYSVPMSLLVILLKGLPLNLMLSIIMFLNIIRAKLLEYIKSR